uniref:Uncharacterized protein n=1 Tax=Trypanosoma congolense (strain IL3000) TaxID=1068625 RepID=G0UVI2_TRYCI|nr:conserved hypothetical protein [Trypanosoma congolense IL3000]
MEDTASFSALLQRAAPATRRRVLVVLFALNKSIRKDAAEFSLSSIILVLKYVMVGVPVRFLLAGGGKGSVLRSHDRGRTWRVVYRIKDAHNNQLQTKPAPEDKLDAIEGMATLEMSNTQESTGSGDTDSSNTELGNEITHVSTLYDRVAVCGKRGFLAVSIDRGLTFSTMANGLLNPFLEDVTGCQNNRWDLGGVSFLSESVLLFFCKKQLFKVDIVQKGYSGVELGGVSLLRRFSSAVGCMKTFPLIGAVGMRELYVATKGFLHCSRDGGEAFVDIPHKLGVIRAIEPLDLVLRREEIPRLPQELVGAMIPTTELLQVPEKEKTYFYKFVVRVSEKQDSRQNNLGLDLGGKWMDSISLPFSSSNVQYRALFVAGVGADILPYDYTALLFVAAYPGDAVDCPGALGSWAERVDYVPYIKSGLTQPLSVALMRHPGSRGCMLVRANVAGVSFSTDMGKSWSVPKQAYVLSVVALDGGELICCYGRHVVNYANGTYGELHAIQADLRVPFFTDIAVMISVEGAAEPLFVFRVP